MHLALLWAPWRNILGPSHRILPQNAGSHPLAPRKIVSAVCCENVANTNGKHGQRATTNGQTTKHFGKPYDHPPRIAHIAHICDHTSWLVV